MPGSSIPRPWPGGRHHLHIQVQPLVCTYVFPHYKKRNVHIEWEDVNLGRKVKGNGITPKFSQTPGEIWRGSVPLGYDNEAVYTRLLGLSADELAQLQQQGVI